MLFSGNSEYFIKEVENDNFAEAIKLIKPFALQGDADAQYNIGRIYGITFTGLELDYKEAEKWLKLAAEQGHVHAQFSLGLMYYYGQGVKQDYAQAVRWYMLAAEQGNTVAQEFLAKMFNGIT